MSTESAYGRIQDMSGGVDPTGNTTINGLWLLVDVAWVNADGTATSAGFWVGFSNTDNREQIKSRIQAAYVPAIGDHGPLVLIGI
jgi:Tfp pilus assembly protein PilZ